MDAFCQSIDPKFTIENNVATLTLTSSKVTITQQRNNHYTITVQLMRPREFYRVDSRDFYSDQWVIARAWLDGILVGFHELYYRAFGVSNLRKAMAPPELTALAAQLAAIGFAPTEQISREFWYENGTASLSIYTNVPERKFYADMFLGEIPIIGEFDFDFDKPEILIKEIVQLLPWVAAAAELKALRASLRAAIISPAQ